jgi:hypothetical protein
MTPLETYLTSTREIRSSGEAVDENLFHRGSKSSFNQIGNAETGKATP